MLSRCNRRRKRRFSLIELMIVLIIMGLLTALVAPAVMGKLGKAKVQTAKTQIKLLSNAVDDYYLDMDEYPSSLEGLIRSSGGDKWDGPYLKPPKIPKDPWGNDYHYQVPGSEGMEFEIVCYGADGSPGGAKKNADINILTD